MVLLLLAGTCCKAEIYVVLLPLMCVFAWYDYLLKSNFQFLAKYHELRSGISTEIEAIVCAPFTPRWNVL